MKKRISLFLIKNKNLFKFKKGNFSILSSFKFNNNSNFKYSNENITNEEENIEEEENIKEEENEEEILSEEEELKLIIENQKTTIDELNEKINQFKQKYHYSLAENENIRRIAREDVDKAKKYGISNFALQMLDVADNLELAVKSIEEMLELIKDGDEEIINKVNSTFKGVDITLNILRNSLKRNNIDLLEDPTGEIFNPEFHEAISRVAAQKIEDFNLIANVVKNGYTMEERILRPSQVLVFVDPVELGLPELEVEKTNYKEDETEI